ncbi:hypothetical protein [Terribacillus saccharophilus]|uniref:hypothetical protein n=1 Tax=Terribacillus saccharophilus TaxID=361277 RepID=UPI002989AA2E|nr:hypothetical protein [Terribacillus saccharophilus]MCM3227507.1 hypothetical protein [Terribacillus saccharophilus]
MFNDFGSEANEWMNAFEIGFIVVGIICAAFLTFFFMFAYRVKDFENKQNLFTETDYNSFGVVKEYKNDLTEEFPFIIALVITENIQELILDNESNLYLVYNPKKQHIELTSSVFKTRGCAEHSAEIERLKAKKPMVIRFRFKSTEEAFDCYNSCQKFVSSFTKKYEEKKDRKQLEEYLALENGFNSISEK